MKSKFDFDDTMQRIAEIPEIDDRIKYLLSQIYAYKNRDRSGENIAHNLYEEIDNIEFKKSYGLMSYADKCKEELDRIKLEQEFLPIKKKENEAKIVSYKWLGVDTELPELFLKMKDVLISNDTTPKDFRMIFSEVEIAKIKPIKWHDSNASELLYFILQLSEKGLIKQGKQTNYKALTGCFVKNDGNPFQEKFKSLKQNLDINLSQKKKDIIDDIIAPFT